MRLMITFLFTWALMTTPHLCAQEHKPSEKIVSGWIERIQVEGFDVPVKAKLDTGAKTSSIYAVNIELIKKQGKEWVSFDLKLPNEEGEFELISLKKPLIRKVKIKNHKGKSDKRFVVELNICFDQIYKSTQFNLVDRSNYIYPILIGRRFLKGNVVVDSEIVYQTNPVCDLK